MPTTVEIVPSVRELPEGISADQWLTQLRVAADAWTADCANLKLVVKAPSDRWSIQEDGQNTIVFRGESWCKNHRCGRESTYPSGVAAMTTTYGTVGSAPVEADIELNTRFYSFSFSAHESPPSRYATSAAVPGDREVPLQAVLVHEFGHLLGLPDQCDLGHFPGSHAKSDCHPNVPQSVMHAPARLMRPTPLDLEQVCQLFTEVDRAGDGDKPTDLDPFVLVGSLLIGTVATATWLLRRRAS